MFSNCRNSKKKGDAGLGAAIAHFTLMGLCVCVPLTDSQDYDLVVDVGDKLARVQVKTTAYKNDAGNYSVSLSMKGGNSKANFVHRRGDEMVYDYLFILTESGSTYLIPREVFAGHRSQIVLSKKYDEYKLTGVLGTSEPTAL